MTHSDKADELLNHIDSLSRMHQHNVRRALEAGLILGARVGFAAGYIVCSVWG